MKKPFVIKTEHKNLMYWKEPKKLTGRIARWHEKLQDYNFKIVHIPGKTNGPADALSRMDQEEENREPKLTPLISSDAFLNIFEAGDPRMLEDEVVQTQRRYEDMINKWEKTLPIVRHDEQGGKTKVWTDKEG